MKRLLLLLISTIFLMSCTDLGIDVKVKNVSKSLVDSIIVTNGYDNIKFEKLEINSTSSKFLTFSNNVKYDGNYGIKVFIRDKVKLYHFGYYSNGIPIDGSYIITVLNDTIEVGEIAN